MTVFADLSHAPVRHYGLIYLDPAWRFKTYAPLKSGQVSNRSADRHYPTMSLAEMKALPVRALAARDCFMVMWTSWPHLPTALELMAAYGFTYTSSFVVWAKLKRSFSPTRAFITNPGDFHYGTGYSTRKSTEFAILGRRGAPRRQALDVHELVVSPVREHSRKPDEVYGLIERFAAGPYLEMNARTERPGWDQWGNEVNLFVAPPHPRVAPVESDWTEPERQRLLFAGRDPIKRRRRA